MIKAKRIKNTYIVTVIDDFFKKELEGAFDSVSEKGAETAAKRYYASELGTVPSAIKILGTRRIR